MGEYADLLTASPCSVCKIWRQAWAFSSAVLRLEFTRSGHIVFEKLTVTKRNNQNLGKRKIPLLVFMQFAVTPFVKCYQIVLTLGCLHKEFNRVKQMSSHPAPPCDLTSPLQAPLAGATPRGSDPSRERPTSPNYASADSVLIKTAAKN